MNAEVDALPDMLTRLKLVAMRDRLIGSMACWTRPLQQSWKLQPQP